MICYNCTSITIRWGRKMNYSFAKDNDWVLIITTFLLAAFGILMVFSSSYVYALYENGNYAFFFQRQLMWFGLGSLLFAFVMHVPYTHYRRLSMASYFLAVILLFLVITVGTEVNNAQRWLGIGGFTIQPSEFVKLLMIIYLANVYSKKNSYIDKFFKGVFPPLIAITLVLALIMGQPDLGTATSILVVTGLIVFFSGAKFRHLMGLVLVGLVLFIFVATSASYRLGRILSFINPFEYADGAGYQVIQSYIAIAHGGLTGAGLGQSIQKLMYLPEPHTDFIFAIIAEELGIFGACFVLLAHAIIFYRGVIIGTRCKNLFGSLLAFGIVFQIAIQVVFNLGAVTGLLPITGIPLPFVSNGGSSLLVSLVSIAILANISRYNIREKRMRQQDISANAS